MLLYICKRGASACPILNMMFSCHLLCQSRSPSCHVSMGLLRFRSRALCQSTDVYLNLLAEVTLPHFAAVC